MKTHHHLTLIATILLLFAVTLVYTLRLEGMDWHRILRLAVYLFFSALVVVSTVFTMASLMLSSQISRREESEELRRWIDAHRTNPRDDDKKGA